jgi:hypothetical protein
LQVLPRIRSCNQSNKGNLRFPFEPSLLNLPFWTFPFEPSLLNLSFELFFWTFLLNLPFLILHFEPFLFLIFYKKINQKNIKRFLHVNKRCHLKIIPPSSQQWLCKYPN